MHLPKFTYHRLSSRAEAARLLKEFGTQARLVAGGTDLYPRMKYGLVRPKVLVSLKDVAVKNPEFDESGNLHIDPLMTLADLARSPIINKHVPLLTEAALCVASNQIRNSATLGGNICLDNRCLYYNQSHTFQFIEACFKRGGDRCYLFPRGKKCFAVFLADTVPALISLGASITCTDGDSIRSLKLEQLYTGDALRPLNLNEGDILTEVLVPAQSNLSGMAFMKYSLRGGVEFAGLNVGTVISMEGKRHIINGARLTAGAIAPVPIRLMKAEAALIGQTATQELFEAVARLAAAETSPVPHHGYSATYLRNALEVHVRRSLQLALDRATSVKARSH